MAYFSVHKPCHATAGDAKMKRIAVISSDKSLERTLVPAIESSAAAVARAVGAERIEVVPLCGCDAAAALHDPRIADCDKVLILGSAGFVSGRLSAAALREPQGSGSARREIYILSWQHDERTVLGLIEGGADQYMTFPLSLQRLCVKLLRDYKL